MTGLGVSVVRNTVPRGLPNLSIATNITWYGTSFWRWPIRISVAVLLSASPHRNAGSYSAKPVGMLVGCVGASTMAPLASIAASGGASTPASPASSAAELVDTSDCVIRSRNAELHRPCGVM